MLEITWKSAHMEGKPQFNSKGRNQVKTSKGFHVEFANQQASESSTSTAVAENSLFSKEQLELLYKLMGKTEVTSQPSYAFTQSGISEPVLCLTTTLKNVPWIIDSGASDHMTQESKVFSSYTPCSGKQKVFVANESHIAVHRKGSIMINENIT